MMNKLKALFLNLSIPKFLNPLIPQFLLIIASACIFLIIHIYLSVRVCVCPCVSVAELVRTRFYAFSTCT